MKTAFAIRPMAAADAPALARLIRAAFLADVAPGYRPRGVRWFLRHTSARALLRRQNRGQLMLVGRVGGEPAGMIAVRSGSHVTLLFVDPGFRRLGVGRALFAEALQTLQERRPELEAVTVNSSDFALPFYRSLGFLGAGARRARKGMRFTPLLLPLASRRSPWQ